MKTHTEIYNEIITSNVFRTDGHTIDLPAALLELGQAVHAAEEPDWYLGEHTEAPLSELIVGAYWALSEWHRGQASTEYAALCALGAVFKPGCTGTPTPEENEWAAYMLICQALGGHVLFEPDSPENGGNADTWENWWVDMPDAVEGMLLMFSGIDVPPCRIPCATLEDARRIMGENTDLAGLWKPAKGRQADTAPTPSYGVTGALLTAHAANVADTAPVGLYAFTGYLRETLIPDLRAAEMDATADDFEECLRWIGEIRSIAMEFLPAAQVMGQQLDMEGRARLEAMVEKLHS